ncbi:uncharacterized protein BHQ10_001988 [Talaromyces amestolkiae]|uniref:Aflatoxin regulatory protein domain-containing protein n=1 Tax=Talaromyces amestolkiae TaxID=1196081 RepID=A0A364KR04_TALAM|nr:uncharacterized protein BHQ10_001988 [Talaromyces amestolkiae]RAO65976.1 hypothetical protein BHQ10_001988 [Talaromyces amestolkiae]
MSRATETERSTFNQSNRSSNSTCNSLLPPNHVHASSLLPTLDACQPSTGFSEEELGFVANSWSTSDWDWTSEDQALDTLASLPIGVTIGAEPSELIPQSLSHPHPILSAALESFDDFYSHERIPPSSSLPSPSRIDDTELRVEQLSELTSRLYLIYRASCGLTGVPQNEHSGSQITTTVFEAVTTLFQEDAAPMAGNTIYSSLNETFTACRTLLEILSRLLENVEPGRPGNRTGPPQNQPPLPGQPTNSRANINSIGTRTGGDSQEPVLYHMTTTCYNLLLLIHVTLISALHRDAISHASRVTNPSLVTSPSSSPNSQSMYSAPSMVELQLVLLVQVMTYFLDRLQQTMGAYSAQVAQHQRRRSLDRLVEEPDEMLPYQMVPPDTISALENRARSKLNQLRRALHDSRSRN